MTTDQEDNPPQEICTLCNNHQKVACRCCTGHQPQHRSTSRLLHHPNLEKMNRKENRFQEIANFWKNVNNKTAQGSLPSLQQDLKIRVLHRGWKYFGEDLRFILTFILHSGNKYPRKHKKGVFLHEIRGAFEREREKKSMGQ